MKNRDIKIRVITTQTNHQRTEKELISNKNKINKKSVHLKLTELENVTINKLIQKR